MNIQTRRAVEGIDFAADRDATLKLVNWFSIERLRAMRALVVGAGAIGNETIKNLALLGIGHLFIFDRDRIEMANLSRSILYRESNNGQLKTETAVRAVAQINSNVNARGINGDVRFDLGLGLLRRMDVVIGCLDNREARYHLNRACRKTGRPMIDAGIGQLNGQVQVFAPGDGPCYECSFSREHYEEISLSCNALAGAYLNEEKAPTTPMIASIVAAVQVQEALKMLDFDRWQGRSLAGKEFIYNGTAAQVEIAGLPRREDCPAHDLIPAEKIVPLPEVSTLAATVEDLMRIARERLGQTATIALNFELAVELRCEKCRRATPVLAPMRRLVREQLKCLGCDGEDAELKTTHLLGWNMEQFETSLGERTLSQLGVPPLDLLCARGADGKELYLELTGDAARVFQLEP
jgi:adenylyltransferase/sulfurtransferase